MKHFAEALVVSLLLSVSAFLYCLAQIILEIIRNGWCDSFTQGCILGMTATCSVGIYLMYILFWKGTFSVMPSTYSTSLNTTQNELRTILGGSR